MKALWLFGMLVCAAAVPLASVSSSRVMAQSPVVAGDAFAQPAGFRKPRPRGTPTSDVMAWNEFASNIVAANLLPGPQTYTLALVHLAIHDALNAIDPRYKPYAFVDFTPGASTAAAVAAVVHKILVRWVPQATAAIDSEYQAALSAIPEGSAKQAGIATGQAAAAAILDRRSSDDLVAALTKPYTPGVPTPGVYQLTPPLNFVIAAGWNELPPFGLKRPGQFHPASPPSVESRRYAADYDEVKNLGSAINSTRTDEQTAIAQFWYDVAAKEWNLAAHTALADAWADEWQAARTLAVLNVALADAVIATFETKFHENYWRPITAIRAGDDDGNWGTSGDPTWEPLCVSPPFPEYSSTHAATAAAAASALALALGDRHMFTVTNPSGARRTYDRFSAAAFEEGISRIYCGIHFRSAMRAGFMQGARIGHYVHKLLLKPLED